MALLQDLLHDSGAVAFGSWQLGGSAGDWHTGVDDSESIAALHAFIDGGGRCIDTANVYGAGHSERLIAQAIQERSAAGKVDEGRLFVITKAGRAHGDVEAPLSDAPHGPQNYTYDALKASAEGSLARLAVSCLDCLQLHCPPTECLADGSPTFAALEKLKADDLIATWGVSVETCEEALLAIAQPGCSCVQLIFNIFRRKPLDAVFAAAAAKRVTLICRVPLASGMLAGTMDAAALAKLSPKDHRSYNRAGAAFDKVSVVAARLPRVLFRSSSLLLHHPLSLSLPPG